jgi:hypothetical protein
MDLVNQHYGSNQPVLSAAHAKLDTRQTGLDQTVLDTKKTLQTSMGRKIMQKKRPRYV